MCNIFVTLSVFFARVRWAFAVDPAMLDCTPCRQNVVGDRTMRTARSQPTVCQSDALHAPCTWTVSEGRSRNMADSASYAD